MPASATASTDPAEIKIRNKRGDGAYQKTAPAARKLYQRITMAATGLNCGKPEKQHSSGNANSAHHRYYHKLARLRFTLLIYKKKGKQTQHEISKAQLSDASARPLRDYVLKQRRPIA